MATGKNRPDIDVLVSDHGSVVLVHLHSERAQEWVAENVQGTLYFGHNLVVEPRYFAELIDGMALDGLKIG